jgi:hypothetical protein
MAKYGGLEYEQLQGCSDGGCIIKRPQEGHMHTNGGCNCLKDLSYAFMRAKQMSLEPEQYNAIEHRQRFVRALQFYQAYYREHEKKTEA